MAIDVSHLATEVVHGISYGVTHLAVEVLVLDTPAVVPPPVSEKGFFMYYPPIEALRELF